MVAMVSQKPRYKSIESVELLDKSIASPSTCESLGKRILCSTYPHRLIDFGVAVAMGVLVVSIAAWLAWKRSPTLSGGSQCCPAERLHRVRVGCLKARRSWR